MKNVDETPLPRPADETVGERDAAWSRRWALCQPSDRRNFTPDDPADDPVVVNVCRGVIWQKRL